MKKWMVIAAMTLSVTAFTACGSKNDTTDSGITNDQSEEENTDDQAQTEDADSDADNEDSEDNAQEETQEDASAQETEDEGSGDSEDGEDAEDGEDSQTEDSSEDAEDKELIETGEEPDFKVDKNGRFNGTYEGNDGCVYKFTKKGILTVTSDSETVEWEYSLNGDLLNMMATDGSMGQVLQITLLDDGTYLLDDTLGTQVVLTYVK